MMKSPSVLVPLVFLATTKEAKLMEIVIIKNVINGMTNSRKSKATPEIPANAIRTGDAVNMPIATYSKIPTFSPSILFAAITKNMKPVAITGSVTMIPTNPIEMM